MECWGLSKHKSWLYWPLMVMMIHILMFGQTQVDSCIEEERKALLQIKASHMKTYDSEIDHFLPTWVDYGSSATADGGSDCCDWERVTCNLTTGHVTDLSLGSLTDMEDGSKLWALNVSLFLHFKELRNLNLSHDYLDQETMKTGLERLSSLKKLEVLDLSFNYHIGNDILPLLKNLTSLKVLDLSDTSLNGNFHANGLERLSSLKKLEVLDLSYNYDIDNDILPSLKTLTSLKVLNLRGTGLYGTFHANELSHLTNLEELDLRHNRLDGTPDIQACKSLSRLKRLKSINLSHNNFNKSIIISCLSALPSLRILDLTHSFIWESLSSFPVQEFLNLSYLEVLILRDNGFNGMLPMEAFASFHHLEVLDLSQNSFVGSIPSSIQALSSLRALSFAFNELNGSLLDHGFCDSKNLIELDLSHNMLHGSLPQCFDSLSSLKFLDISSNRFSGIIPPSLIPNLTSLEYIDFSHNKFEGSFSFSSFSNHTKLEFVRFISDNDKFEVETEEPVGWIPMFQLQILKLSNCNMKTPPGFLLHQHKLRRLDMTHNSFEGHFPNWLVKKNTNLEVLNLVNNLFGTTPPLYWNANMTWLDMSGNRMIGNIPDNIPEFFPNIVILNLSMNSLSGVIPSSVGELSELQRLDLSDNQLSGEVPKGLFTNLSVLSLLKLSKNNLYGEVLSGNLSLTHIDSVHLDSNHFTGTIGSNSDEKEFYSLETLDISNNFFTGMIPDWIGNLGGISVRAELLLRNNSFEGRFPCGTAQYSFLDMSQNSFFGPIPSCLNLQHMEHLHLGSNRFTGSVPKSFRNLTNVLTLDICNNDLSGMIPEFLGKLSNLRILLLRKNNFSGSIPRQLCQLHNVSLLDLSHNSLTGSIPSCLQNITGPSDLVFFKRSEFPYHLGSSYQYGRILGWTDPMILYFEELKIQDEVEFTTKSLSLTYKGEILDYMSGLDLSCNKLTGEIPEELGLLTKIHALNLSHNQLTGPIPVNFSNLAYMESLDLSFNGLTGRIPSELVKLTNLSIFSVSHNNLSGRLPERTAQFGTFEEASYEGNPLLCGPPLKKSCSPNSQVTNNPSAEEGNEKWYDIDMTCFYASSGSTGVVLLLGFVAILYINPQWRRRWLDWVEGSMFTCYYFLYDLVMKPSRIFRM